MSCLLPHVYLVLVEHGLYGYAGSSLARSANICTWSERRPTFHAVGTHIVHPLSPTAGRTPAQGTDILQRLACHLPVPLLHVRRLLLGHRP